MQLTKEIEYFNETLYGSVIRDFGIGVFPGSSRIPKMSRGLFLSRVGVVTHFEKKNERLTFVGLSVRYFLSEKESNQRNLSKS